MANKFDLDALQASNFEGAARTHIEKAYQLLTGDESIDGLELEYMREQCRQITKLNNIVKDAPKEVPEPKTGVGRIPNLSAQGTWEGRMRRVTVHNPNPDSLSGAFTLGWEGVIWTVLYDEPVDMPWPYWEALRNAVKVDKDSTKAVTWVKDEATGQMNRVSNPIRKPTHNYTDHGDVPGTEHLPTDYVDFFRQAARRTHVFRESKAPLLLLVYSKLFDGPPLDKNHQTVQLDHTALRVRIAERLGTEFVGTLNEEIYAAA